MAIDSTGIKVTNRGDWIREKHGVQHKGWIKIHIAVDAETMKPVAFEITDERIPDQKMVDSLLKDIRLKDALMDAAYDKEDVYKILKDKDVLRPGINLRKDAIIKPGTVRSASVLEHKEFCYYDEQLFIINKHYIHEYFTSEGSYFAQIYLDRLNIL